MKETVKTGVYCEKGERLYGVMLPVIELPCSIVYLNRTREHRGRCIVAQIQMIKAELKNMN
jgi:hypothetical protein